ncbi:MAG TPA: response regulator, partial [Deltaproteobacteria bacterium]|nr:response regulator [Deltaproteobacteria bacterium]
PTQIHQILMNLCTNAAHAMEDKGGVLSVEVDETELDMNEAAGPGAPESGRYMVLTVSDTGCGMAPEITQRIFDPYFSTKEKDKGTGLGLAVVHGIVASNRGTIRVESEPGRGTTFRIYLPRIIIAEPQDLVIEKRIPNGTERILFVDDEPVLTNLARQMLEGLGYTVTTTTDSEHALVLFRSGPHLFDLVITDMTMPKMTGEMLAQELLRIRHDVPVILCTGYSASMSEDRAIEMGIRAFALKPLLKRDLANKIRSVLDKEM